MGYRGRHGGHLKVSNALRRQPHGECGACRPPERGPAWEESVGAGYRSKFRSVQFSPSERVFDSENMDSPSLNTLAVTVVGPLSLAE